MSTTDRSIGRLVVLPVLAILLALTAAWLSAGSAWAAPGDDLAIETPTPEPPVPPQPEPKGPEGPGDLTNPVPRPAITIKVQPDCTKTAGFHYSISPNQEGPWSDYKALWGPTGSPLANSHAGQSGFIASGEGEFTVVGHAVLDEESYQTGKAYVVVKCDKPKEPGLDLKVRPDCTGKPGFHYELIPLNDAAGWSGHQARWQADDIVRAQDGKTGFVATGEGQFTVSGQGDHGGTTFETNGQRVLIDCSDKPRRGNPNFTG